MKLFRSTLIAFALCLLPSIASATTCAGGTPANTCYWIGGTGTWDNSGTAHWSFTTGGTTCSCLPSASSDKIIFDGSSGGGTVTVDTTINGSTFSSITAGAFTGTLDFSVNNPSLTLSTFSVSGSGTRSIKLGSGTFTLTGASNVWDATTTTGLTASFASSTISITGNIVSGNRTFVGGGQTYGTVSFSSTTTGTSSAISGSPTIATLNLSAPLYFTFVGGTTTTVTNALNWSGSSSSLFFLTSNTASTATVSAASGSTISWAALAHVTFTTNAVNATNSFDMGSNNMNGGSITPPATGGGGFIIGG